MDGVCDDSLETVFFKEDFDGRWMFDDHISHVLTIKFGESHINPLTILYGGFLK